MIKKVTKATAEALFRKVFGTAKNMKKGADGEWEIDFGIFSASCWRESENILGLKILSDIVCKTVFYDETLQLDWKRNCAEENETEKYLAFSYMRERDYAVVKSEDARKYGLKDLGENEC